MARFSRSTIIEACVMLESKTHAEIDRFLLRFELENIAETGHKKERVNALIKHLIDNPESVGPSGSSLTYEIIEKIIDENIGFDACEYSGYSVEDSFPGLVNSLKRDGFSITVEGLKTILPQNVQLAQKGDELNSLLDEFDFVVPKGHLDQALSAHTRSDWAAANSQMRPFIEGLFDSFASLLADKTQPLPSTSHGRRELLAKLDPPFFLASLNEWEIGKKGGFVQGFWSRLHPEGSHPGLSEEDSTFRLHLVVLVAWHYMKRLEKRLQSE